MAGVRKRYRLLDVGALAEALAPGHCSGGMAAAYREMVDEALRAGQMARDARWTESLAVKTRGPTPMKTSVLIGVHPWSETARDRRSVGFTTNEREWTRMFGLSGSVFIGVYSWLRTVHQGSHRSLEFSARPAVGFWCIIGDHRKKSRHDTDEAILTDGRAVSRRWFRAGPGR